MYKVFVNEKKLTLGKSATAAEKNLRFDGPTSLEMALDLLENTSCAKINLFGADPREIWETFTSIIRVVDAAGGVVFDKEGRLLFIHRLGKWDLPKGKLEPQEFLKEAALREVEEETGLKALLLENFIDTTYHVYKEKKKGKEEKILKATYWFKMSYHGNEKPKPQVEEGITEVGWKSQQEIEREVLPNTFQNIKLILKQVLA